MIALEEPLGLSELGTSTVAGTARLVWRLALDSGLTPEQAQDVCFVTLHQAMLDPGPDAGSGKSNEPEQLLRTAVEQCTVAKTLAWQRPAGVFDIRARHAQARP